MEKELEVFDVSHLVGEGKTSFSVRESWTNGPLPRHYQPERGAKALESVLFQHSRVKTHRIAAAEKGETGGLRGPGGTRPLVALCAPVEGRVATSPTSCTLLAPCDRETDRVLHISSIVTGAVLGSGPVLGAPAGEPIRSLPSVNVGLSDPRALGTISLPSRAGS